MSGGRSSSRQLAPFTLQDVEDMLGFLDPGMPRDQWVTVAMAIKAEFGEAGFDAWDAWSQGGDSYDKSGAATTWRSISAAGGVGLGTLVHLASAAGWKPQATELTEAERRQREKEAAARRKKNEQAVAAEAAEKATWQERIAEFAEEVWVLLAKTSRRAPYLGAKQVKAHGVRFARHGLVLVTDLQQQETMVISGKVNINAWFKSDRRNDRERYSWRYLKAGTLVVPMRDVSGKLWNLQLIFEGGGKKFLKHGRKAGTFHTLAFDPLDDVPAGTPLMIGEGYATVASAHEAIRWPGVVAWDAGNLEQVAAALHEQFPQLPILVLGDDDHESEPNAGRIYAPRAAERVGGLAAFPVFAEPAGRKDWNDLAIAQGQGEVAEQLQAAGKALAEKGPDSGNPPSPPPTRGNGGAPDEDDPGRWQFDLESLVQNYVLIYGTETVFDEQRCEILTLGALRAAAGKGHVREWMEHPRRRIVSRDDVVFEPAGTNRPNAVNLFRGWPLQPKDGECTELLELLLFLCNDSYEVFTWVLRWAAYPLQHPGAKMRTSIVMHGPEGTGKNLFWGALQRIYGEYSGIITQTELESTYNSWASRKLLLIGNEVVSRQEMYHQKGRLKNMITEDQWCINEKYLPARWESNHTNFVFLSNAHQPVAPDPDDRRLLVIWTPPKKDEAFYQKVADELKNGGVEAFYHFLLNMNLAGFNEHTKPIQTIAKTDLIEASMDSHERFFRQWQAGELPVRFLPCRSMDCYRAYRRWCDERGERSPAREAVFLAAMGKRMPRAIKRFIPPDRGGMSLRQGTVLLPPGATPPDDMNESTWLTEQIKDFYGDLEDWAA